MRLPHDSFSEPNTIEVEHEESDFSAAYAESCVGDQQQVRTFLMMRMRIVDLFQPPLQSQTMDQIGSRYLPDRGKLPKRGLHQVQVIQMILMIQMEYENSEPHEPRRIANADLVTRQGQAKAKSFCYLLVTLKLQLVAV